MWFFSLHMLLKDYFCPKIISVICILFDIFICDLPQYWQNVGIILHWKLKLSKNVNKKKYFDACAIFLTKWFSDNILGRKKRLEFQREFFHDFYWIWSETGIGLPKINCSWELKHKMFFQSFWNLLWFFKAFRAHVCHRYWFIFSFLHCLVLGLEPEIIELITNR